MVGETGIAEGFLDRSMVLTGDFCMEEKEEEEEEEEEVEEGEEGEEGKRNADRVEMFW